MSDDMLNLMALRYGSTSGVITLGNFISLILRFECMNRMYIYTGASKLKATIIVINECADLIYVLITDFFMVFRIIKLNEPLC